MSDTKLHRPDEADPGIPTAGATGVAMNAAEQVANIDVQVQAIRLKAASNHRFTQLFAILTIILFSLGVAAPFFLGAFAPFGQVVFGILAATSFFISLAGWAVSGINSTEIDALYKRKDTLLQLAGVNAGTPEASYFDQLVAINVSNLAEYYALVKVHTARSFAASLGTALVGFLFVITGLAVGFLNYQDTPPITWLATTAGVLTEFIAGVIFYLYNKTVRQLKEYHDSLLAVQNILLSFKIIEDIRDETRKTEMIAELIGFLIVKQIQPVTPITATNSTEPKVRAVS